MSLRITVLFLFTSFSLPRLFYFLLFSCETLFRSSKERKVVEKKKKGNEDAEEHSVRDREERVTEKREEKKTRKRRQTKTKGKRKDEKPAYASIDVNQLVQSAYLTRKKVCESGSSE